MIRPITSRRSQGAVETQSYGPLPRKWLRYSEIVSAFPPP
jgi:hypothetical protein